MAWRLKMKARKAPKGMEVVQDKLEEFEREAREALNTSADDKRRNEITWPMHKLHYRKNRYLFDMHYRERRISKQLLDYLVHTKVADGKLMAKWRRPGYETVCSVAVITKSNTNFQSTGICRVPLHLRKGQILPNVLTGCVSCASGDKGPIWWDDPIPFVVKKRIVEVDPGKIELLDREEQLLLLGQSDDGEEEDEEGGEEGGGEGEGEGGQGGKTAETVEGGREDRGSRDEIDRGGEGEGTGDRGPERSSRGRRRAKTKLQR